jgi:hypothetical protein
VATGKYPAAFDLEKSAANGTGSGHSIPQTELI